MRTITLTAICILAILFSACNKAKEETPIDGHLLRMEILKNEKAAQKQVFAKLNHKEKAAVWQDKFKQVLSQDWLSKSQTQHLNSALELITPELFLDNTKEADYFINHFEPKWRDEGIQVFTFGPFKQIANSLSDFQPEQHLNKANIIPIEDGPADNFECECSSGSDWCWFQNCDGTCHLGSDGCGTLWRYKCDGSCVN